MAYPVGGIDFVNIYLIGTRGAGKSAVGRRLAADGGRPFCDMDIELARRFGRSIREFVQTLGWPAFRAAEKSLLAELAARQGLVVSTGGGVVLAESNIAGMRRSGQVVWLHARPETLLTRLQADAQTSPQRPALTPGLGPAEEIRRTLAMRAPLYRRAMHWEVDTEGLSVAAVCRVIREHLEHRAGTGEALP